MESNLFTNLSRYIEDVTRRGQTLDIPLIYEGMRLTTFHRTNFATSTVRLAAAGFYATGFGDETKCYSCAVTHRGWRVTDNPFLIHKKLSSGCRHIMDTDTGDSPNEARLIQFGAYNNALGRHFSLDVNSQVLAPPSAQHATAPSATLRPASASTATSTSASASASASATASTSTSASTSASASASISASSTPSTSAASVSHLSFKAYTQHNSVASPLSVTSDGIRGTSNKQTSLRFEGAVHPHYCEVVERLKTFVTWPVGHCKKPGDLVSAGFFYAGYSDCVRCFVCGVGLRTWEQEDDPWTEHVRWRSSCDYVSAVKGKDFVIQILAAIGRENREVPNTDTAGNDKPSASETVVYVLETAECRRVLEMGFNRDLIMQTATAICSEGGRQSLTLDVLIERLVTAGEPSASEGSPLSIQTSATVSPLQTLITSDYSSGSDHVGSANELLSRESSDRARNPDHLSNTRTCSSSGDKEQEKLHTNPLQYPDVRADNGPGHKSLPVHLGESSKVNRATERKSTSLPIDYQATEEENRQLKESSLCKVCLDDPANIVFLPCGHLATCATCAPALERCPICRKHIRGTVRVYLANKASMKTNP